MILKRSTSSLRNTIPPRPIIWNEMIKIIQRLLDKGIAYKGGDGSIYFAIRQFPRYGCLSHRNWMNCK